MMEELLTNHRFPKFMDKEGNVIDMMVDHKHYGTIPFTVRKGEELHARAAKGDFGRVKPFLEPQYSPELLADWAHEERIRRVNEAYISPEKRHSAYGYFAKLSHIPKDQLSAEQQKDIATLHAADDWESEMIARVPHIVAQNAKEAITRDSAWPKNPVAQALRELCEQC